MSDWEDTRLSPGDKEKCQIHGRREKTRRLRVLQAIEEHFKGRDVTGAEVMEYMCASSTSVRKYLMDLGYVYDRPNKIWRRPS